jgi:hypothetical protein
MRDIMRKLKLTVNETKTRVCKLPEEKFAVERHARKRLRRWLCAKHKVDWPAIKQFPEAGLHDVLGLVRLTTRTRSFPWATS